MVQSHLFMEFLNKLENCKLFCEIASAETAKMLDSAEVNLKRYQKDDYIIHRGSFQNSLIILVDGLIESEIIFENGKVLKVTEQKAPYVLSAALIHGHNIEYPIDVIARTDVSVLKIDKEGVFKMMQAHPIFLRNYMQVVAERTNFLYQKLTCFSFRSLREKFILYLLSLSQDQQSDHVIVHKSQSELAQSFGVNRPSLAREVRALHHAGFIEADGKEIKVLCREKLSQQLSCKSNLCVKCLYIEN